VLIAVICFYVLQNFSLLLIAFVGIAAGIAVAVVYRDKLNEGLHDVLKEGLNKYDNDTGCQKAIDFMQTEVSHQLMCVSVQIEMRHHYSITLISF